MVKVDQLSSFFGDRAVVRNVSFELQSGEIGVLVGPSGSGKTTVLRSLAQLHQGRIEGRIYIPAASSSQKSSPLGFVFQNLALFPHLTVEENLTVSLSSKASFEEKNKISQLLKTFRIEHLRSKRPHEISGGEKQRVAVARALVHDPELLLLDEPFSSLDLKLRRELREEIFSALRSMGVTTLLVTHDIDEAFEFADSLGLLNGGELVEWGHPLDIYLRPSSRFAAEFFGPCAWLPAEKKGEFWYFGKLKLDFEDAESFSPPAHRGEILIRPESIQVVQSDQESLEAKIVSKKIQSHHIEFKLETCIERKILYWRQPLLSRQKCGDLLNIRFNIRHGVFLRPGY